MVNELSSSPVFQQEAVQKIILHTTRFTALEGGGDDIEDHTLSADDPSRRRERESTNGERPRQQQGKQ